MTKKSHSWPCRTITSPHLYCRYSIRAATSHRSSLPMFLKGCSARNTLSGSAAAQSTAHSTQFSRSRSPLPESIRSWYGTRECELVPCCCGCCCCGYALFLGFHSAEFGAMGGVTLAG